MTSPPLRNRQVRTQSPLRAAFTLAELLVTIMIFAILLVLSFSSYGVVQKKWKTAGCVSNLRQIGALFGLYLAEHNMYFPPTSDENQILVGGQKGTYPGYNSKPETRPLSYYANKDYRVFQCPADVGYRNNPKRESMQPEFKGKTYFEVMGSSYRYNARNLFGKGSLTKVKKPVNAVMYKLADIKTPSCFIVMGDSDAFSWQKASVPWWTQWHGVTKESEGAPGYPGWPIANVLFADWHVETIAVGNQPSPHNFGNNYHFDVDNQR